MADYTNSSQQRVLRLVGVLAGHEIHGIAPAQIRTEMCCSASDVTRDLANLQQAGWAEQVPATGAWRLAPYVVQIAVRHQVALAQAEDRLGEIKQRYSRTA